MTAPRIVAMIFLGALGVLALWRVTYAITILPEVPPEQAHDPDGTGAFAILQAPDTPGGSIKFRNPTEGWCAYGFDDGLKVYVDKTDANGLPQRCVQWANTHELGWIIDLKDAYDASEAQISTPACPPRAKDALFIGWAYEGLLGITNGNRPGHIAFDRLVQDTNVGKFAVSHEGYHIQQWASMPGAPLQEHWWAEAQASAASVLFHPHGIFADGYAPWPSTFNAGLTAGHTPEYQYQIGLALAYLVEHHGLDMCEWLAHPDILEDSLGSLSATIWPNEYPHLRRIWLAIAYADAAMSYRLADEVMMPVLEYIPVPPMPLATPDGDGYMFPMVEGEARLVEDLDENPSDGAMLLSYKIPGRCPEANTTTIHVRNVNTGAEDHVTIAAHPDAQYEHYHSYYAPVEGLGAPGPYAVMMTSQEGTAWGWVGINRIVPVTQPINDDPWRSWVGEFPNAVCTP